MSKVFIVVPNMGWINTPLAMSLPYWDSRFNCKVFAPERLSPASYARNFCVKKFLDSDCDHLWTIDADTCPPLNALDDLLDANVPAISGITNQWKRDIDGVVKPAPMIMREAKESGQYNVVTEPTQMIEKIDAAGLSCFMARRIVFERLECPWYTEKSWGESRGCDITFFKRLTSIGINLYAHFGVVCMHRKEGDI